jgi:hypothetical protein
LSTGLQGLDLTTVLLSFEIEVDSESVEHNFVLYILPNSRARKRIELYQARLSQRTPPHGVVRQGYGTKATIWTKKEATPVGTTSFYL